MQAMMGCGKLCGKLCGSMGVPLLVGSVITGVIRGGGFVLIGSAIQLLGRPGHQLDPQLPPRPSVPSGRCLARTRAGRDACCRADGLGVTRAARADSRPRTWARRSRHPHTVEQGAELRPAPTSAVARQLPLSAYQLPALLARFLHRALRLPPQGALASAAAQVASAAAAPCSSG